MQSLLLSFKFIQKCFYEYKSWVYILAGFILSLGLASCQQFTKKYCEDTNWRKEAFLFALSGENRDKFHEISKKCKSLKVEVDQQVFNEGFDEGASQFCEPKAAFEYGKSGYMYKGTCKTQNENEYLKKYNKGRLSFLQNQYDLKQKNLEESDARLWRKKNEFELEANTNPNLAVKAYDEMESLKAENERIKSELETLKQLITDLQKETSKNK
jgi:hypothetical protein